MGAVDPIEILVLILAIAGLVAVVLEIARKDPSLFIDIATDCEKMARPPAPVARENRGDMSVRFRVVPERASS